MNVLGGMRVGTGKNTRGYLNINGPVTMTMGGDTFDRLSTATNGVGEMNMSAGSITVGQTSTFFGAVNALTGRFQIGHRGKGTLNMSGGTITCLQGNSRWCGSRGWRQRHQYDGRHDYNPCAKHAKRHQQPGRREQT